MSVRDDQIVRELSHYLHEHPADTMALLPVYDAARDHSQRRACTHGRRCPVVVTGAVVLDERHRVLCLRHEGGYALAEAEPEDADDSLFMELVEYDVVLSNLHGPHGEDGRLQGLLDYLRVPYCGSGVGASAVAADKILCKRLMLTLGVPAPGWHRLVRWSGTGTP
ncbi:hypothetical protein [Streptomyces muensis]|uniref:D-alanine--D-alanine ligase N-terminal domain-containing protein n=1 Tax=Streptomyces muensis TaxID=1077944 RepID=A0A9X1TJD8_STRM4|nr:hypothetical protein [Streptomyces muensis]MCF1593262.1 hypothetical protein [Streptomyces muensis]